MLTVDISEVERFEAEFQREVNRFDQNVRGPRLERALFEGTREAVNTRHYQDRTALLTSRIKGFVEISTPGAAEAVIGAFTDYASYVNRWDANQHGEATVLRANNGEWVVLDIPEGFIVRGADKTATVLLEEIDAAAVQLQRRLDD